MNRRSSPVALRGCAQSSFVVVALVWLAWTRAAVGADWYVDNLLGDDTRDGRSSAVVSPQQGPLATITRAIQLARAGDTIHLNPTGQLYRQTADFYRHPGGVAGRPLVLDGHGATLSGADPCPAESWQAWRNGIWKREAKNVRIFVIDGRMVFEQPSLGMNILRPGEFHYAPDSLHYFYFLPPKGKQAADCRVEVGQPGGNALVLDPQTWHASHSAIGALRYPGLKPPTWVKLDGQPAPLIGARERLERLQPGQWCLEDGMLYYYPQPGTELRRQNIELVVRQNGVQMTSTTSHVIVRNLNVIHVYNDGYNIHGHVTHAEFYHCNARDCGDEGFSSHDDCETLLDGAVYVNCDNGIANVNQTGYSITRNVTLQNARNVGFLIEPHAGARHELVNAILLDSPVQLSVGRTNVDNVLIVRTPRAGALKIQAIRCAENVELRRLTVAGNTRLFQAFPESRVLLESCLFAPGQGNLHVRVDKPEAVLRCRGLLVGAGMLLEYGSRPPWRTVPLAEWFRQAQAAGVAEQCSVEETAFHHELLAGRKPGLLPIAAGCTMELIDEYCTWAGGKTRVE